MFVLERIVQWIALEGEALRRALRWLQVGSICVRLLGTRGGGYGDEAAATAVAVRSPVSRARGCECE
eukprot:6213946-Pleurochrysis_carterae.AAC.3